MIKSLISRKLSHRPTLARIIENISWLFLDKVLRMGFGLLVGVWVARFLGPDKFGLINFATAFTSLFGAIAILGLPGVVVRDLIRDPNSKELTLGSAGCLHFIGGVFSYCLIMIVIAFLRPDDDLSRTVVAIIASMMFFKISEISVYWFESQIKSKYIVWVRNSVFLLFIFVKIVLLLNEAPFIAFVWVIFFEALIASISILCVMNVYGPSLLKMRVKLKRIKELLNDSWPLILSAIAVSIYMQIDQIMLGQMKGDKVVGIYSAAVKVSEIWYFIPIAIASSVFPSILEAKKKSERQYYACFQQLYDAMVILSISVAVFMTFFSKYIIFFLFGDAYEEAGRILSIHIWASIFVFLGVASSKWFLAEERQIISLHRTTLGAIVNVVMNVILIPIYGGIGAAIATVFSYAAAAFLADFIHFETRKMFFMKLSSLCLIPAVKRLI